MNTSENRYLRLKKGNNISSTLGCKQQTQHVLGELFKKSLLTYQYIDIYCYICREISIYNYMVEGDFTTNQDIISLLSKRLKEYRLAARISQKEMAERSGVSLTTICHLEQGVNRNITLNNFISLLRVVGMEQRLEDLLPELPMPPMALKQINKLIPKRVRRNS